MESVTGSRELVQICVVTKDAVRSNRNWAAFLGQTFVAPNMYYDTENPRNNPGIWYKGDMIYDVGYETNTFDLAQEGTSIQFEVLKPQGGPSEWLRYLNESGGGIHHIAFRIDDREACEQRAAEITGNKIVHKGHPYPTPESKYAYFDTKETIGTTIEVLDFGAYADAQVQYRRVTALFASTMASEKPVVDTPLPCAVTLVVKDIDASAAALGAFVGMLPPSVTHVANKSVVLEESAQPDAVWDKADFDLKTVHLEMIKPRTGNTVWSAFADRLGDGFVSVAFESADLDATGARIEDFGGRLVQEYIAEDGLTVCRIYDLMEQLDTLVEIRSSERIRAHLADMAKNAPRPVDLSRKYNEATRIGDLGSNPAAREIVHRYLPGFYDNPQVSTSARLPLGISWRLMAGKMPYDLSEDRLSEMIDALNAEA